jgi:V8-like Glu-specific endopeptidase
MTYTIYKIATGEILRIVICNNPNEQLSENEAYLEGEFSDIEYQVVNGEAVTKQSAIFDAENAAIQIRIKRNKLLTACDWTQVNDVPVATSAKWATYRQSLRDITQQTTFPENVTWPVAPT